MNAPTQQTQAASPVEEKKSGLGKEKFIFPSLTSKKQLRRSEWAHRWRSHPQGLALTGYFIGGGCPEPDKIDFFKDTCNIEP